MDSEIVDGKDINLSKYYTKSTISIYKHFKILKSNKFHAFIVEDDNDKQLFNLHIYNPTDLDSVIEFLIKNKYFNINFDLNFLRKHNTTINSLLENYYNMPYIYTETDEYQFPHLSLIYNRDIKPIQVPYIQYMLNEYSKQEKNICQGWCTFHQPSLHTLQKRLLVDKHEISGKLSINQTLDETNKIVFEIMIDKVINNGDDKEVDSVESPFNFHTHPKEAYFTANTELGWPSIDDYIIFIMAYIVDDVKTYFHWICTLEGIYLLTIPKETVEMIQEFTKEDAEKFEKKVEDYLYENVDVDKYGFRKDKGIEKHKIMIKDAKSYINFINKSEKFTFKGEHVKLFDISFFSWDGPLGILTNNRMYYSFYYPKIEGNCIPNSDQLR